MQPLMVEPTGSVPKRNMLKTLLLGALALVGIVVLLSRTGSLTFLCILLLAT
jgi:hypothetical protein